MKLKKSGVADEIISAMIEKAATGREGCPCQCENFFGNKRQIGIFAKPEN